MLASSKSHKLYPQIASPQGYSSGVYLIRCQEQTGAARSLLNTAQLMEQNPLLLRVKDLESLERLVEKIGHIDPHAGERQGRDALLTRIVRLKAPDTA